MNGQSATEQLPEILHIDGVLHTLFTTPLSPWFREFGSFWRFDRRTPNCSRGYIGRWELKDNTLWLINFYAWQNGKKVGISDLFDGEKEVAADWFSGVLVVEPAASEIPDGAAPEMRTIIVKSGRTLNYP